MFTPSIQLLRVAGHIFKKFSFFPTAGCASSDQKVPYLVSSIFCNGYLIACTSTMQRHWTKLGDGRVRLASARRRARVCSRRRLQGFAPAEVVSALLNSATGRRHTCGNSGSDAYSPSEACGTGGDSASSCPEDAANVQSANCRSRSPPSMQQRLCISESPARNMSPKVGIISNSASEKFLSQHAGQWSPVRLDVSSCEAGVPYEGTQRQDRSRRHLSATRYAERLSKGSQGLASRMTQENALRTESSGSDESYNSESTSEASGVSWVDFSSSSEREMRSSQTVGWRRDINSPPATHGSHSICRRGGQPGTFPLEASLAPPERQCKEVGFSQRMKHKSCHCASQSTDNGRTIRSRDLGNRANKGLKKIFVGSGASNQNEHNSDFCGSIGSDACDHSSFPEWRLSVNNECRWRNTREEAGEAAKDTMADDERQTVGCRRKNSASRENNIHVQASGCVGSHDIRSMHHRSFQDQLRDRNTAQQQEWEADSCGDSELSNYRHDLSLPQTPRRMASGSEANEYGLFEVSRHRERSSHSEVDFMEVNGSDRDELPQSREITEGEFAELPSMSRERPRCRRPPRPLETRRHFEGRNVNRKTAPTAAPSLRSVGQFGQNSSRNGQEQVLSKKALLRGRKEESPCRLSVTSTSPSGSQGARSDGWSTYTGNQYFDESYCEVSCTRRDTASGKIRKESPMVSDWSNSTPPSSTVVTLDDVNASIDWIVNVGSNPKMIQKVQEIIAERLQTRGYRRQQETLRLDHHATSEIPSPNYFKANRTRSSARAAAPFGSGRPDQVEKSPNFSPRNGRVYGEKKLVTNDWASVHRLSWSSSDVPLLDPSCEAMLSVQLTADRDMALQADQSKNTSLKYFRQKAKRQDVAPLYASTDFALGIDAAF
ncbi:hypothetical protein TGARI_268680 [Toxoplasma gondii ARI]|uniref:Uncharacterized protein n=1 Tax=Toxoplasma gondii ARI TaxID=1074872 RepID=A0A139Y724_TOXGO|nr:hypothetical protein TGARI_268680 [Toxoplasma gondii ARI]